MAGQKPQAEQNHKPDVTANVPNEVLCLVFSHISSFRDRFRLAAVNKKFRECVIKEMNKPAPLDVKLMTLLPLDSARLRTCYPTTMRCHLNDMIIDRTLDYLTTPGWDSSGRFSKMNARFDNAVQALAGACKFSKITISSGGVNQEHQYRLFQLLGQTDCLDKVTTFEATGGQCSNSLAKALNRCDQLSVLRLTSSIDYHPDLAQALKPKHLTELVLELDIGVTRHQVIELFRSLKPNTLRKLQLTYRDPWLFAALAKRLRSAWATVEEIYFESWGHMPSTYWPQMFEALATLPSLQLCNIKRFLIDRPPAEFGANLAALFNLSGVDKNLTLELDADDVQYRRGCWFVGVIRQLQDRHPALQMELNLLKLKLVLGAVSIIMSVDESCTECPDDACEPCKQFYPNVIKRLWKKAAPKEDGHLENYRLDRCKVNSVVEDCNKFRNRWSNKIKATHANEEQDLVTVTFEAADHQPFHIAINTGHCLDNSCIRCLQID